MPSSCSPAAALIIAHGFTVEQMVELVRAGLAAAAAERVAMGRRTSRSRGCGSPRKGGERLRRHGLKRVPIGDNQEDYDVLEDGVVVGRIFFLSVVAPEGHPWMWASGHNGDIRRAAMS